MTDTRNRGFEELVVRYQGLVCGVAYAVLRDRARSEEVAQEAFLLAWRKLPELPAPPTMPGWICGIAKNLAMNAARRRKETAMNDEPAATTATPLQLMLDRENEAVAREALGRLRDVDREVVVLYYREDGAIADVAAALGISVDAAKQRLHRGRERLKSAVDQVAASLRNTRPGPVFTAACIAGLVAHASKAGASGLGAHASNAGDGAGADGTLLDAPKWSALKSAAVVGGLAVAGVVIALIASQSHSTNVRAATSPNGSDLTVATTTLAPVTAPATAATPTWGQPLAASDWQTLHARIKAARATRGAPASATAGSGEAEPDKTYDFSGGVLDDLSVTVPANLTHLDKSTLRYGIRSVQPLLLECYDAAYDRLPRKDGVLRVRLMLAGEPDVATVVESVDVLGDAHFAADAELVECLRESLMSVELPPLEPGGRIAVEYPFTVTGERHEHDSARSIEKSLAPRAQIHTNTKQ